MSSKLLFAAVIIDKVRSAKPWLPMLSVIDYYDTVTLILARNYIKYFYHHHLFNNIEVSLTYNEIKRY